MKTLSQEILELLSKNEDWKTDSHGNLVLTISGKEIGSVVETEPGVFHAYVPNEEEPIGEFDNEADAKAEVEAQ